MIVKIFLILVVSLFPSYLLSNVHYEDVVQVKMTVNELLEEGFKIEQINTVYTNRVVNVIHLVKKNRYVICYMTGQNSVCTESRKDKLF